MPPRKKPEPKKERVADAWQMLAMDFVKHCQKRHAVTMRFRTKGEHAADHRLHADQLDHTHAEQEKEVQNAALENE